jgi:YYY domain-containing protein
VLALLASLLYFPFTRWYGAAYGELLLWRGSRTPVSAYLWHWGLFLFVIASWMASETYHWMKSTPLSSLRRFAPYRAAIYAAFLAFVTVIVLLLWFGIRIPLLVLPLFVWALLLLFRSAIEVSKRLVLVLTAFSVALTLAVEVVVLQGDIGRMNTVFKVYLQVWTMLAICCSGALGWMFASWKRRNRRVPRLWTGAFAALVACAALYPLVAIPAKVRDRMAPDAPTTLDGMAFLAHARYTDDWGVMDLGQDYRAIRWMQENVPGSPVIVEATQRNLYRWGSRFSVYTGLPGVVGWEWHQKQQRALVPDTFIKGRLAEVDEFYLTTDLEKARRFLRQYEVRYVIVGQQERGRYPGDGLRKFDVLQEGLWKPVYRDRATTIYEVTGN